MIRRARRQNVTVLSIEHGEANTLDLELCVELEHALAAVREDGSEAVVLTGRGAVFSAGVDLRRLLDESDPYLDRFLPALERTLRSLFVLPKPLVAAINGRAIADGFLLAQAADLRLVADGPLQLGVPELRVGVPFPTVGLEVLRDRVGTRIATDLALSGRRVGPEEASRLGLVDRILPAGDLLEAAIAAAADLATIPAATFALTKRQLRRPVLEVIDRDALAFDAEVRDLWSAPDVREALAAYVDRVPGED